MALRAFWQHAKIVAVLAGLAATAVGQALDCSVAVGGGAATPFTECAQINGVGNAFVLAWTLNSDGSVAWGIKTSGTGGYGESAAHMRPLPLLHASSAVGCMLVARGPSCLTHLPCVVSPWHRAVSFAFPEKSGDMVPAQAFALQACASCPGGAQLRQW